ncbi:MAG: hypothetical protein M1834_008183 [Cirrosporium novae-zelandiae]|nr:MAG: hypothetical protein M1834_008183 [Cirrosporium novae-zelandiae]
MPQPLASKEGSLFRSVVKHYENKQYKKGLKAAEQVLRKVPNHGETLAMKALILHSQGHGEEAFALAKTALRNDMKSHICWHVYGLLYRAEKNYEESIKAYKFALKIEPDSPQIARDLASLQIQTRDYEGYIQSRNTMLQARPQYRQNWTALAVAYQLGGHLADAEKILTTYEETLKNTPPRTDIEHSEAVLYKNSIIAEMGDYQRALDHLDAACKHNLDRLAVMEMRAHYLLKLERKEEAEEAYKALLDRNAENRLYYDGLVAARGIDESDHKKLKELYDEYVQKNPRGDAARRIPLDFLDGDDFREAADVYLKRIIDKRVPSLFANIKALYSNEEKKKIIQDLVEGYLANGKSTETNGEEGKKVNGDSSHFETYTLYFLAQHYNYRLSRDLPRAMELIDKALEQSPKTVEFYMTKARIWKHYGNTHKAAETMNEGRELDKSDRYINSKTARYQLRNDQNELALETASMFTRNEAVGGPLGDLQDMQVLWYLTEDAESYLRQRKLGLALKRFTSIFNIFDIWQEDQYDFHTFSLRKGQIRAYIEMFRWEDHLRDHPYYTRAAISAVKAYLLLHDHPELKHGFTNGMNGVKAFDDMDENEKKKAIKKAKREQQKLEKAEKEKKDAKKANSATAQGENAKKVDDDPQGKKLLETENPLKDAMRFLTPLLECSPKNIDVQNLGFEVFIRRTDHTDKLVLALKCLLTAHSIDPSDTTHHLHLIRFAHIMSNPSGTIISPKIKQVLGIQFITILSPSTDPEQFNADFLAAHPHSAPHIHGFLKTRALLDEDSQEKNETELLKSLEEESAELEDGIRGLEMMRAWKGDVKAFVEKARGRWPEATVFSRAL